MLRQVMSQNFGMGMLSGHAHGQQATETLPLHLLLLLASPLPPALKGKGQCSAIARCAKGTGLQGRSRKGQRSEGAKGKRHRGQQAQRAKPQGRRAQ